MADSNDDIKRYLKGEMSPAEMHALEKRALDDPFLADALEGASNHAGQFEDDIDELHRRISSKTTRRRQGVRWYYQAAAAVLLMGVSATLIYYLSVRDQAVTAITMNTPRETQENYAAPADSLPPGEIPPAEAEGEDPVKRQAQKKEAAPRQLAEADAPAADSDLIAEEEVLQEEIIVPADEVAPSPEARERASRADTVEVQSFALRPNESEAAGAVARERTIPPRVSAAKTKAARTVKGKVTDSDDGLPLPGVNVLVKGTETGTMTDVNGNYELQISDSTQRLVFSFIGLESREVNIPRPPNAVSEVNVQMEPEESSLNEVVVVGYGTENDVASEDTKWEPAEPAGGKKAFRRYLESNLRYPKDALENNVEGKVTVQFTIEPTGSLTDFRVVRGLGHGCDEEVIRLIKEGPEWRPAEKNDEPIRGKAKVRLRFALPDGK